MLFIHAFCPGQCCGVWFSHGFTQNSGVIFFPAPQTFIKYLFLYGWEGPVLVSSPCSICFCFRVPWPPIYDTATTSLVRSLRGHTASLTAMAVSPNGLFVATCATDLRVKVYGEAAIGYSLFEFSAADSFPACFSTHSCTHGTHKHTHTKQVGPTKDTWNTHSLRHMQQLWVHTRTHTHKSFANRTSLDKQAWTSGCLCLCKRGITFGNLLHEDTGWFLLFARRRPSPTARLRTDTETWKCWRTWGPPYHVEWTALLVEPRFIDIQLIRLGGGRTERESRKHNGWWVGAGH